MAICWRKKDQSLARKDHHLRSCKLLEVWLHGAGAPERRELHITGDDVNAQLAHLTNLRALWLASTIQTEDIDIAALVQSSALRCIEYVCIPDEAYEQAPRLSSHTATSLLYELAGRSASSLRYLRLANLACYIFQRPFFCGTTIQLVSLFLDGCILDNEQFAWLMSSQISTLRNLGLHRMQGVSRNTLIQEITSVAPELRKLCLALSPTLPSVLAGIAPLAHSPSPLLSQDSLDGLSNAIVPHCRALKSLVLQDPGVLEAAFDNLQSLQSLTIQHRHVQQFFPDATVRDTSWLPKLREARLYTRWVPSTDDGWDARGLDVTVGTFGYFWAPSEMGQMFGDTLPEPAELMGEE